MSVVSTSRREAVVLLPSERWGVWCPDIIPAPALLAGSPVGWCRDGTGSGAYWVGTEDEAHTRAAEIYLKFRVYGFRYWPRPWPHYPDARLE